jgi:hypothetical protein
MHLPDTDITEMEPTFEHYAIDAFIQFHQSFKPPTIAIRAKITHSTEIAARTAPKPSIEHIPVEYRRYAKVFDEEASYRLLAHHPWDHTIDLIPNAPPLKRCGIYSLTPIEETMLKEWLHESLRKGYIRPSKSPMASSFFFVAKKDGKLRPVQNYIPLNDITVKNEAPLPLISDLLDKLRTARYFTKLDVRWGYNNVRIKHGDEWKAAFKTKFGLYEPLVMTFGLCNAPATFQTIMQEIFEDLIDDGHIIVYLDDILIYHDSLPKLNAITHEVLQRFIKWDLYLKPEKCSFAKETIEYLGFLVFHGHINMDPEKVSGIMKWPIPANVKKVQSFLGFCNFYRRFIQDYSTIARPLFDLTRKDVPFIWGHAQQRAYDTLLKAFTTAPLLALPDPGKPYRLITDASDFAAGAILEQPDALNRWHPVAYYSKSLQPAERNYEIHNKELLAIILALENFRHYLEGHAAPIEIWTDHGNLVYFTRKQKLSR